VEAGDPTVAGSEAAEGGSDGGKNKLILFGGIGVGAVVVGVVLALFVLKPMMASSDGDAGHTTEQAADDHGESSSSHKSDDSRGSGDSHAGKGESLMYSIDDIVINPAGTGGSRFLSVSFGFELDSPQELARFRSREPVIRDALITILSSKTVSQLTDVRQKEIIRYQIKKRVGELMKTEALAGVYYTDFVLQ